MLNKEEIKKIIPQREPFLMIDEVEEYIPGESAIAYKNVEESEWYFKGHFPGNPIMPGVLITESLAQTGAVAILSMEENKGKNALFGGIDKMKFKKMVVPGDRLKLEVKIIKRKGPIGIGEAIATVDGKIAAKGELTFALIEVGSWKKRVRNKKNAENVGKTSSRLNFEEITKIQPPTSIKERKQKNE